MECVLIATALLFGVHIRAPDSFVTSHIVLNLSKGKETEGLLFGALFFCAFFLAPFCFNAGKKERSDAYVERAGPQAPKGVLGCNTLSPKRSVGLQNPKP